MVIANLTFMRKSLVKILVKFLWFLGFLLVFSNNLWALEFEETNYFATIKANKANIRTGPGKNYQTKFTYNMRYLPVKVVSKYDNWNEIEDYEGERGWINQNLLSLKRTIMVRTAKSFINMYSAATTKSRILLKLEDKVVAKFIGCKDSWCKIEIRNKSGWVQKSDIWGV